MSHTDQRILADLDKLGEALKALGEPAISLSLYDGKFSAAVRAGAGYGCDTFGHGDTPSEALNIALAKKAAKTEELAVRARITAEVEERVRAELAANQPQDIAA